MANLSYLERDRGEGRGAKTFSPKYLSPPAVFPFGDFLQGVMDSISYEQCKRSTKTTARFLVSWQVSSTDDLLLIPKFNPWRDPSFLWLIDQLKKIMCVYNLQLSRDNMKDCTVKKKSSWYPQPQTSVFNCAFFLTTNINYKYKLVKTPFKIFL